ncbi:hypothetical protein GGR57DRAFT_509565 [Xylariaceae sp. FL1272]|nr:hypothetical protein GGR57DRAFT_509565 [Xylariaceae sp. FL1272]
MASPYRELPSGSRDLALKRLKDTAKSQKADCDVLLTKNFGGDVEADARLAYCQLRKSYASMAVSEELGKSQSQTGFVLKFVQIVGSSGCVHEAFEIIGYKDVLRSNIMLSKALDPSRAFQQA